MIEEVLNNRFEKAMFNLLRNFNFIDHNVGLLIASTPNVGDRSEINKKLSKMTSNRRMTWLKSLLKESDLARHIGEKGVVEFKEWYLRAKEVRELRNRFAHAIWRFYPSRHGSPVSISAPIWMIKVHGYKMEESLSLEELEEIAAMVEKVFKDYGKLIKKYGIIR